MVSLTLTANVEEGKFRTEISLPKTVTVRNRGPDSVVVRIFYGPRTVFEQTLEANKEGTYGLDPLKNYALMLSTTGRCRISYGVIK